MVTGRRTSLIGIPLQDIQMVADVLIPAAGKREKEFIKMIRSDELDVAPHGKLVNQHFAVSFLKVIRFVASTLMDCIESEG